MWIEDLNARPPEWKLCMLDHELSQKIKLLFVQWHDHNYNISIVWHLHIVYEIMNHSISHISIWQFYPKYIAKTTISSS